MKIIRGIIVFLFLLTVIELLGYYVLSQKLIVGEVLRNHQPLSMAGIDNMNVYSNYQPSQTQKQTYVDMYQQKDLKLKRIRFFSSAEGVEQYIDTENNYNYVVEIAFTKLPFAVVEEGENRVGNTAIRQSKYLWCLYTWVLVKKQNGPVPSDNGNVLQSAAF